MTLGADPSGLRGCARGRAHNVGRRMNTPVADQSPVRGSEGPPAKEHPSRNSRITRIQRAARI